MSQLRREEYIQFLSQDTISFEHPCKKHAGKRFLRDTLEVTRKKYLQQSEFHTNGVISYSCMKDYIPNNIFLVGRTPLDNCLCPKCRNCEQLLEKLRQIGVKLLPSDKYKVVASIQCPDRYEQMHCNYNFPRFECIVGQCANCGVELLEDLLKSGNEFLLKENRNLTWRRWMNKPGKTTPDNLPVKGTLKQAISSLLDMLPQLSRHLFRATWNRNIYDYIKKHLEPGQLVQVFDFSMNFRNFHQLEVQSAFFNGTQTGIHCVITHLLCLTPDCKKLLTIVFAQITADLEHDSFVARAGHEAAFRYLAENNIPFDLVMQFCDNCGSQYKSRRPFAEMARSSVKLIRTYFGESHGKGECDGFFGRLKQWMTTHVKSQKVILNSAHDFFIHCRDKFPRKSQQEGQCEHYKVVFQYLTPSEIRRHQDCNLEKAVEGMQSFYSVRNTPEPLKLKVRQVPCLCKACIKEDGSPCENASYADEWKEVDLIPVKGDNKKKHMKKKHPRDCIYACRSTDQQQTGDQVADDNEENFLPDLPTEISPEPQREAEAENEYDEENDDISFIDLTSREKVEIRESEVDGIIVDMTGVDPSGCNKSFDENDDIPDITFNAKSRRQRTMKVCKPHEECNLFIPDRVLWESTLATFELCLDFLQLAERGQEIHSNLPRIREISQELSFKPGYDRIDRIAESFLPEDAPQNKTPVSIKGDGNCLPRALSRAYSGDERMHLELRARIVTEAIVNKDKYLSDNYMLRGSMYVERDETLCQVYAGYSDFYRNGLNLTPSAVENLYMLEVHDCAKAGSYMGLWQLAQAATVLNMPIRSVYPMGCDIVMRRDFDRWFFPLDFTGSTEDGYITIMWTPIYKEAVPSHFVPLVPSANKYEPKRVFIPLVMQFIIILV